MAIVDKGDVLELKKLLKEFKIDEKSGNILLELIGMHGHREIIDDVKKIRADYPSALESLEELEKLLTMLESFGFRDYLVNLGIARGLDYYTGCVFEIYVEGLGAQKQISGGGTYNLQKFSVERK